MSSEKIQPQPVYVHPEPLKTLAPRLSRFLPTTISILRRIQFHHQSPHVFVAATFPVGATPDDDDDDVAASSSSSSSAAAPWAAIYIDRSRSPELEGYLFSSAALRRPRLESPRTPSQAQADSSATAEDAPAASVQRDLEYAQLISLLHEASRQPLPEKSTGVRWRPQGPRLLMLGSLHESILELLCEGPVPKVQHSGPEEMPPLEDLGDGDGEGSNEKRGDDLNRLPATPPARKRTMYPCTGVVHAHTGLFTKLIFPPQRQLPASSATVAAPTTAATATATPTNTATGTLTNTLATSINRTTGERDQDNPLPPGYVWGLVRPDEYAKVTSRTMIQRHPRTLDLCPSVAVRSGRELDGELVAWAFLGVDGSLITLHVEDGHRGKGMGSAIMRKVATEAPVKALRGLDAEKEIAKMIRRRTRTSGERGSGMDGEPRESEGDGVGGGEKDGVWFHCDVAPENIPAQQVSIKAGGQMGWINYWAFVDLAKVEKKVGQISGRYR